MLAFYSCFPNKRACTMYKYCYNKIEGGDEMRLIANCIGLTDQELEKLNIKTDASLRVTTRNGLTQVKAVGIYDDLIEILTIITTFHTFEVHLE